MTESKTEQTFGRRRRSNKSKEWVDDQTSYNTVNLVIKQPAKGRLAFESDRSQRDISYRNNLKPIWQDSQNV